MFYRYLLILFKLKDNYIKSKKKVYHLLDQGSANYGPNAALKVKMCGPRAPFQPEMYIKKNY